MQHHVTLVRSANPLLYTPEVDLQVTHITHERIGIDEVRAMSQQAYLRPASGSQYVLVVRTQFVTHEAQNALLKLLEEPPEGVSFQLVVPESLSLLPTLMSRVGVEITQAVTVDQSAWNSFQMATPADRLKQIESWNKTKDAVWLQAIIRGVRTVRVSDMSAEAVEVLQLVSERLATRGASNKMLLEHLALALPLRK